MTQRVMKAGHVHVPFAGTIIAAFGVGEQQGTLIGDSTRGFT